MYLRGVAAEFFEAVWDTPLAHHLNARVGDSGSQSCFEYMTLYLVLLIWGPSFTKDGLSIASDNTAALANAVSWKGRGGLNRISMEISWRKVRQGWRYQVAHLPAEGNTTADALSRTSAPAGAQHKALPEQTLKGAARREVPKSHLWVCS